jgi:hypothetical protein
MSFSFECEAIQPRRVGAPGRLPLEKQSETPDAIAHLLPRQWLP